MTEKQIYEPVYYDLRWDGFFYRLTVDDPRQGPFATRASAVADAKWRMEHGKEQREKHTADAP